MKEVYGLQIKCSEGEYMYGCIFSSLERADLSATCMMATGEDVEVKVIPLIFNEEQASDVPKEVLESFKVPKERLN